MSKTNIEDITIEDLMIQELIQAEIAMSEKVKEANEMLSQIDEEEIIEVMNENSDIGISEMLYHFNHRSLGLSLAEAREIDRYYGRDQY